ncbi:hypothetical protein STEG23_029583 [Scotinomys teguina]
MPVKGYQEFLPQVSSALDNWSELPSFSSLDAPLLTTLLYIMLIYYYSDSLECLLLNRVLPCSPDCPGAYPVKQASLDLLYGFGSMPHTVEYLGYEDSLVDELLAIQA